jgi:hypothetical protein
VLKIAASSDEPVPVYRWMPACSFPNFLEHGTSHNLFMTLLMGTLRGRDDDKRDYAHIIFSTREAETAFMI